MIYHNTPWSTNKNLGVAYNDFMKLLPNDEDFACFKDGDAMFTTDYFGKQLEDVVAANPDCGLFTCMASRIGCLWQRAGEWHEDDISEHRRIGRFMWNTWQTETEEPPTTGDLLGGVLILIKKSTWEKLGGFAESGILGVDNDIHRKARVTGEKLLIMKGVYLYHWYRGGNSQDIKHLK